MDSTEPDWESLYRAAVGSEKADYYVPKFLRFDRPGASRLSWNWPAFFAGFWWGLYRRMYRNSLLFCFVIPLVASAALFVVQLELQSRSVGLVRFLTLPAYAYLLIPLLANSFYHRFIRRKIDSVCSRIADPALRLIELENSPSANSMGWIIAIPVIVFLIGVFAAIAIPAYQAYTIRAQVTEGLNLARPLLEAVSHAYARTHLWVADDRDLGQTFTLSGRYVSQVVVIDGSVIVLYGNAADKLIAGKELVLKPRVAAREVSWDCGYQIREGSVTSVPRNVLPTRCRG